MLCLPMSDNFILKKNWHLMDVCWACVIGVLDDSSVKHRSDTQAQHQIFRAL